MKKMFKDPILTYPNEILNQVSEPVTDFSTISLPLHLEKMKEALDSTDGVGLASIQVGVPLQVLIIKWEDELIEMINPEIYVSKGTQVSGEGCLSIPGVGELVKRDYMIGVSFQDRFGKKIVSSYEGRLSVIIQHEIEHLRGGLYIDNLSNGKKKKLLGTYKRVKKNVKKG